MIQDVNPEQRRNLIGTCLDDEKAEEISFYDLRGKTPIADYMIIANGRSATHIKALAEKVLTKCKQFKIKDVRLEGLNPGDWVIVDAGDVIVHLFRAEVRAFYELDKLWEECLDEYSLTNSEYA